MCESERTKLRPWRRHKRLVGQVGSAFATRALLTMCLAANTPSTMAQQKAATTPKLMKTMDATSCETEQRSVSVETHSRVRSLPLAPVGRPTERGEGG